MPANWVVTRLSLCARKAWFVDRPILMFPAALFVQAVEYVSHSQLYSFCVLVTKYRIATAYGLDSQKHRKWCSVCPTLFTRSVCPSSAAQSCETKEFLSFKTILTVFLLTGKLKHSHNWINFFAKVREQNFKFFCSFQILCSERLSFYCVQL